MKYFVHLYYVTIHISGFPMKRTLLIVPILLVSLLSICTAHTYDGFFLIDGKASALAGSGNRSFTLTAAPRFIFEPIIDAGYLSTLNIGIAYKENDSSKKLFGRIILVESEWHEAIQHCSEPLKPRIEEFFKAKCFDWDRTGVYDVDLKWYSVEYGREYYLLADTVPNEQMYRMYIIHDKSLSFRIAPNASIRTFKPGSFAFGKAGDECNAITTSLFVGMDVGIRLKLWNLNAEVYAKGDKCLFDNYANLIPGASLSYRIHLGREQYKNYLQIGFNYDNYIALLSSKRANAEQISASLRICI